MSDGWTPQSIQCRNAVGVHVRSGPGYQEAFFHHIPETADIRYPRYVRQFSVGVGAGVKSGFGTTVGVQRPASREVVPPVIRTEDAVSQPGSAAGTFLGVGRVRWAWLA